MPLRQVRPIDKAYDDRVEALLQQKRVIFSKKQTYALRRDSYYNVELVIDFHEARKKRGVLLPLEPIIDLLRFSRRLYGDTCNVYQILPTYIERYIDHLFYIQEKYNKNSHYVINSVNSIAKFIDFAFERDRDLVVNGVKVYDKKNTGHFIKCKGNVNPIRKRHFNQEMYEDVMAHLEEKRYFLYRAVLPLLYNTGMHLEDLARLKDDILHQVPDENGFLKTQIYSRKAIGKYYYLVHEDDLQYIDDWFSIREVYSDNLFGIGDDKGADVITQHWMDIFWHQQVTPIIKKDMSFRCLAHDYWMRSVEEED